MQKSKELFIAHLGGCLKIYGTLKAKFSEIYSDSGLNFVDMGQKIDIIVSLGNFTRT
jgi:hypothetical protein